MPRTLRNTSSGSQSARSFLHGPVVRRLAATFAILLALTGVGVLVRPFMTAVWADHKQEQLQQQLKNPTFQDKYRSGDIRTGDGLTRLQIPTLGVDVVVVEGTSAEALRAGAGHYTGTPLPGQPGNVAIAGHRVTYGHPFQRMGQLRRGDIVTLETPFAAYTYTVVPSFGGHGNPWVVEPTDYWVVASQPPGRWLTLTTCHPRGSARERLVVRLKLTETTYLTSKGEGL